MELDLMKQLERSVPAPMTSDSLPTVEVSGEDKILELSLWWSSGNVGSRKRVREGDEAVERKMPKMVAEKLPCSMDVAQDSMDKSEIKRNFEMGRMVADNSQFEAVGGHGLSLPGSSNLGTTFSQSSSPKGESNNTDESRNHSNNSITNNCATFSAFRNIKPRLQKPPTQIRGRKKPTLSLPRSSNLRTTISQSSSPKGESNNTNESRNHSKNSITNNCATFFAFRDIKPRLQKPPTQIRGRKKPTLRRKHRALVFTRSAKGNKIDGYLYRFHKNEVRILCNCHGSLFSAADFVRHAEGPETSHPLRQIIVVAS